MKSVLSRRDLVAGVCSTAVLAAALPAVAEQAKRSTGRLTKGMPQEGPDTPKLAAPGAAKNISDTGMREVKQLGVNHVLMGGPRMPWSEADLREIVDRYKSGGLQVGNLMIGGFPNTLYGRTGRDQEIEQFKDSIRAAGKVGVPVVEYNFYAHRAMEGYYYVEGRGGAGLTGFDISRMKDQTPLPEEGVHSLDEMWANITYFLKAVIPVAEQAKVRLALHPNDPPIHLSRGSGQIMSTVEGWKHLIDIVNSPSNGITWDCGVTRETGVDPIEVCRYFGTRDRINHVHYRNPTIDVPNDKYVEGFIDEGDNDMLAIMRELIRVRYTRLIYPEHERALDYDRAAGIHNQYPGGGGYAGMVFDIGYARAMFQAALLLERGHEKA
ncbi:MAG: mannonate dehydratase [Acidobacteriota bacterium]|nr:mannonate dehydratase [Acidobacteriota bacterium]